MQCIAWASAMPSSVAPAPASAPVWSGGFGVLRTHVQLSQVQSYHFCTCCIAGSGDLITCHSHHTRHLALHLLEAGLARRCRNLVAVGALVERHG